ncbi:MAG: hypothetical protein KDA86_22705 [Planctomycetaceae bacterium]|nr:hypothetical protein [Planctomycetaceae bacterium]
MRRETLIWTTLMVLGGLALLGRAATVGNGRVYIRAVTVAEVEGVQVVQYQGVPPSQRSEADVSLSWPRTIGIWISALCTLGIMSFVLGDNPLYKLMESIFVGVSAAYLMVAAFWDEIVQNLFRSLIPGLMRDSFLPGLEAGLQTDYSYLAPLLMSGMMLWRLAPKGAWIARWPLAFFIGATAGFRLVSYLEADFTQQINNTIMPLIVYAADESFDIWGSIRNVLIVSGVLLGLVYFFFSVPHRGVVGGLARGGVWLLMITFGASFGYTVMGRIALLADRLQFLFDDWLWLIDPTMQRIGM